MGGLVQFELAVELIGVQEHHVHHCLAREGHPGGVLVVQVKGAVCVALCIVYIVGGGKVV